MNVLENLQWVKHEKSESRFLVFSLLSQFQNGLTTLFFNPSCLGLLSLFIIDCVSHSFWILVIDSVSFLSGILVSAQALSVYLLCSCSLLRSFLLLFGLTHLTPPAAPVISFIPVAGKGPSVPQTALFSMAARLPGGKVVVLVARAPSLRFLFWVCSYTSDLALHWHGHSNPWSVLWYFLSDVDVWLLHAFRTLQLLYWVCGLETHPWGWQIGLLATVIASYLCGRNCWVEFIMPRTA